MNVISNILTAMLIGMLLFVSLTLYYVITDTRAMVDHCNQTPGCHITTKHYN